MSPQPRDYTERLVEVSDAILAGVERELAGWVVAQVSRILDAWGKADASTRARAQREAIDAGRVATDRVVAELRALFAVDPERQRATPLQVVRTAYREPTAVLAAAGVPPVVRDAFDERAWPDDPYALVPRTLGDLGDAELGPLMLAWGMAKAGVLRSRNGT